MSEKEKYLIRISPAGCLLEALSGETLVEAAARQGLDKLRFGCKEGGCGRCKLKVLEGEYQHEELNWIHVSAEEESQGITLGCRTRPLSDLIITQEF